MYMYYSQSDEKINFNIILLFHSAEEDYNV